ncbi:choice-of-anchor A family protein [Rubellimicrobium arenae]|uniref:choice-of-anchor A family protein n=1 Tax=Rubellimicrobium arenae TaxID=2817372 RepID=UPI001B30440B|nr:choice-of-anchor A family protein [Rubellimicrobium arenae]
MKHLFFVAGAAATGFAFPSFAGTLSATELLNQFSIITTGNLDTNQDNYGRAYVGGDLNVTQGKADFANRPLPPSHHPDLIVEGNMTGGAVRVGNGGTAMAVRGNVTSSELQFGNVQNGDVLIGGSLSASTLINNRERADFDGIRVQQHLTGMADFDALFPDDVGGVLEAASRQLSGMGGTTTAQVTGGGNTLTISATGGGITVANLDIADLGGNVGQISIALGAADTLVVNVAGTDVTILDNILGLQDSDGQRIIWNFYEASRLDLQRKIIGSILAPKAHLTNSTAIEGSIFAQSATLRGQVHLQPFAGEAPPAAVPLPAGLPLLAAALTLLTLVARSHRAERRPVAVSRM